MRFSIVWIMTIATPIAKCAGSATLKADPLEQFKNDSIPEPASTEERVSFAKTVATLSALPPELSVIAVKKAMARVNAGEEADMIMQKLWSEFIEQKPHLAEFPTIDRLNPHLQEYLTPDFMAFVHEDNKRSEQWMQWLQIHADTNGVMAQEKSNAVAPELMLSDIEANLIESMLWKEFTQIPKWSNYDTPSSIRHMIRQNRRTIINAFLTFVQDNPARTRLFEAWQTYDISHLGSRLKDLELTRLERLAAKKRTLKKKQKPDRMKRKK